MARNHSRARRFTRRLATRLGIAVASIAVLAVLAAGAGGRYEVTPLGDLWSGQAGSFPERVTRSGQLQFFRANDGTHGYELWVTDGSVAATTGVHSTRFNRA